MTEKKTVIFVDDEPNILDGLRRMLRSMRKEFDMHFVLSGAEALEMFEAHDIDIIVSDMRMPGMDGADLLNAVRARSPHTTRIMLTGQADDESVMRCIDIVHQFLAKPCDPEKLKDILHKSGEMHRLFNDTQLKKLISGIDRLPSLPAVYQELQKKLEDPESTVKDVAAIIGRDVAMAAKILQLVNSAFFGFYSKVDTPERAVSLLGIETIKNLVLGIQIFSENIAPGKETLINSLWQHSIAVASMAKNIAQQETEDETVISDTFIAGMLHDIGKLLLITKLEKQYDNVLDSCRENEMTPYEAEKSILHSTHCLVGAYLAGLWGFSDHIVEGIAYHHRLIEHPSPSFIPAVAVHFADACYYTHFPEQATGRPPEADAIFLQKAGLEERQSVWRGICQELLGETS